MVESNQTNLYKTLKKKLIHIKSNLPPSLSTSLYFSLDSTARINTNLYFYSFF